MNGSKGVVNYKLNTELRLEIILLSLTKDNYYGIIEILQEGLKEYDPQIIGLLDKYNWLITKQLQGNIPSKEILKNEFPAMVFDNVDGLTNADDLSDYVHMFITQKKYRYLSTQLLYLADKVRTQGLSDDDTLNLYKYLAESEAESAYVSIVDSFKEVYEKQEKLTGVSFLSPELDKLTGGIRPGQICTILGAPGSMKTTYSSNIAYNALRDGKNILYLSLEEPAIQLFSKWLSRCSMDTKTPIPQKDIVQQNLDKKQLTLLYDTVLPKLNSYEGKLYILDEQSMPNYSIATLESNFKNIDKIAKKETGHGIDMLVVDHIQIMKFGLAGLDPTTAINMYVSFFRRQSLSWLHEKRQISVILLSQANREGYAYAQKNNGRYLSQHVAEASEVERASAYIISVYTDAMSQVVGNLTLSAVKLRGSALPNSVLQVYADGSVYQVGMLVPEVNNTESMQTNNMGSDANLNDLMNML